MYGLYESPEMEVAAQLQRHLDGAEPGRYQVLNTARAGMSPPRITHYFEVYLKTFEPDILIFYPTPHFYLDQMMPVLTVNHGAVKEPTQNSRIVNKALIVFKQALPSWLVSEIDLWRIQRQISLDQDNYIWPHVPPERVKLFQRHLDDLIATIGASKTHLLLCTHLNRFSSRLSPEDKESLVALRVSYPHASEQALLAIDGQINPLIRAAGQQKGLPVIDIERLIEKRPEYFADFSHFTDAGAREVARAMGRAVLAEMR
jgi:hypothetical protein